MTGYFPVDDGMAFHRKVVAAGNAAIGAWTRAGSWSKAEGTGGFIPAQMAKAIASKREIQQLVDVGLWEEVLGGYLFHDWEHYGSNQGPTEEEERLAARREADRKRSQERRDRKRADQQASPDASRDGKPASRDATPSSRDASRDERGDGHVTDPVDNRGSSRDALAGAFAGARASQSSSVHLATDSETSPVPETSREDAGTDQQRSTENEFVEAAAARRVDFQRVRARLTAQAEEAVPDAIVWRIITTVLDRANDRDGDRTGLILTSIRDQWSEHSRLVFGQASA